MDDSKSVVSSGAYGIPKWILKKGMRYEVDDFIVSPPSIDEGGFMRLRYGRSTTHDSTATTTTTTTQLQDGGMTVEVKDDTLQFSSDPPPTTTTISIGPGGLSVESSPNATPLTTPEASQGTQGNHHPLLVLPMNFGGEPKFVLKVDPPPTSPPPLQQQQQTHNNNKDPLGPTAQVDKEPATETHESHPRSIHHQDKTQSHYSSHSSILEKIQALSLNTTPTSSSVTSPVTSPITTPKASPTFSRKLVHMDPPRKISAHSYFCTKQYMEQIARPIKEEPNPREIDESALPPQALDPKMMGKRRRQPKPSALREMNFWAPTSM